MRRLTSVTAVTREAIIADDSTASIWRPELMLSKSIFTAFDHLFTTVLAAGMSKLFASTSRVLTTSL